MAFLEDLFGVTVDYVVPFLFVLTLVVFVHEFGHFIVARLCGVTVEVFSVGFGPELIGRTDRRGTRWRLALIPLGGYVRFLDDPNAASASAAGRVDELTSEQRAGAFRLKSVWRRAAIVAAGPVANFVLAIVIFAVIFSAVGRTVAPPRLDEIVPDGPAAAAGFEPGDLVLSIDGRAIESFTGIQRIVSLSAGDELTFVVDRDGRTVTIDVVPARVDLDDGFGGTAAGGQIGVRADFDESDYVTVRSNPIEAIGEGFSEVWFIVDRTLDYLGQVATGREPPDQLGGPIRVAEISGEVATLGFGPLINLAAILSVSIGLLNLFPIPLLDGGHLVYYAIEALRGRPLSQRTQEFGFRIGFLLVLMLMVFVTWNDIARISGS